MYRRGRSLIWFAPINVVLVIFGRLQGLISYHLLRFLLPISRQKGCLWISLGFTFGEGLWVAPKGQNVAFSPIRVSPLRSGHLILTIHQNGPKDFRFAIQFFVLLLSARFLVSKYFYHILEAEHLKKTHILLSKRFPLQNVNVSV